MHVGLHRTVWEVQISSENKYFLQNKSYNPVPSIKDTQSYVFLVYKLYSVDKSSDLRFYREMKCTIFNGTSNYTKMHLAAEMGVF